MNSGIYTVKHRESSATASKPIKLSVSFVLAVKGKGFFAKNTKIGPARPVDENGQSMTTEKFFVYEGPGGRFVIGDLIAKGKEIQIHTDEAGQKHLKSNRKADIAKTPIAVVREIARLAELQHEKSPECTHLRVYHMRGVSQNPLCALVYLETDPKTKKTKKCSDLYDSSGTKVDLPVFIEKLFSAHKSPEPLPFKR